MVGKLTVTVLRVRTARSVQVLCLVLWAVLCAEVTAQKPIYKVVDANGNVTFTDIPPADESEALDALALPPVNAATPFEAAPRTSSAIPEEAATRYRTAIVSPESGATIAPGPGDFVVMAGVEPALGPSETLLLRLDGQPVGAPQRQPSWQLQNVFRGEHSLQIDRLDAADNVLHRSEVSIVYVLRPSVRQ